MLLSGRFKGARDTRWIRSLQGAPQIIRYCDKGSTRNIKWHTVVIQRRDSCFSLPGVGSTSEKRGFLSWVLEVELDFSYSTLRTIIPGKENSMENVWKHERTLNKLFIYSLNKVIESLPCPMLCDRVANSSEQINSDLCPPRLSSNGRRADQKLSKIHSMLAGDKFFGEK